MCRADLYVLKLAPEPDALLRMLTVVARLPGSILSVTHVETSTRLEMHGLTRVFADLLAERLRTMPCVTSLHYLPGHGPDEAVLDKVAS